MPDTLTPAERSERMSRVQGKDTSPELVASLRITDLGFEGE